MLSSGDRSKRRTAGAAEVGECVDECDQREAHAEAGDSDRACFSHVSDVGSVDDVIENDDHLGQHDRKTEFQDQNRDFSSGEVTLFGFCANFTHTYDRSILMTQK